jgi:hypothetical protein
LPAAYPDYVDASRRTPMGAAITFTDRNYRPRSAVQPVTKRLVDGDGPDFYPTPAWATHALLKYERFEGAIWECACGDGAMSKVLERQNYEVYSSDRYERGFGDAGVDFLHSSRKADNIVTNPPYNLAGEFVIHGITKTRRKLALLLRLAFLEGGERCQKIFKVTPPNRVWVFSERITFYPKNAVQKGSGTTAYAWFVWDRSADVAGQLRWIEPGAKARRRS